MEKLKLLNKTDFVNIFDLEENTGQIAGVPKNPRLIKDKEFEKLKTSLLVFPTMLFLRPITFSITDDGKKVILGGNQRRGGLMDIAKLTFKQIKRLLEKNDDFQDNPDDDKTEILEFWEEFCKTKMVPAQDGTTLSIYKKREFVIKDNIGFGEPDFDVIVSDWGREKFLDWGGEFPADWEVKEKPQKNPFEDDGITAQNQFGVIVICTGEEQQKIVFDKLQEEGYVCKIVVT